MGLLAQTIQTANPEVTATDVGKTIAAGDFMLVWVFLVFLAAAVVLWKIIEKNKNKSE